MNEPILVQVVDGKAQLDQPFFDLLLMEFGFSIAYFFDLGLQITS